MLMEVILPLFNEKWIDADISEFKDKIVGID